MSIRAVFLDLDDTLCDTIGCRPQRVRAAMAHLCRALGRDDVDALVARAFAPVDGPLGVRGHRAVVDELAPSDAALADAVDRVFATDYTSLRLFRSVAETLAELSRSYILGIISNAPAYQQGKVEHLRLERFVRHVTLSGVVGWEKPDPRIFAAALAQAGVVADEAVVVGDRLDVDVAGAKASDVRAIWFNHRGEPQIDGLPRPDATIVRFSDLPSAIAAIAGRCDG